MDEYGQPTLVTGPPRYGRAVLFGVAAAAFAGVGWFAIVGWFDSWLGAPAALVGVATGYGVLFGSGRNRGWRLQAVSVTVALAAMLVSTAVAMRLLATRATAELAEFGITRVPRMLPWRAWWNLVVESFTADVTTLVFYAVGLWFAVVVPRRWTTYA